MGYFSPGIPCMPHESTSYSGDSTVLCKLVSPFMNVIFIVFLPEDSIFHLNVNQVIDLAAESNTLYP